MTLPCKRRLHDLQVVFFDDAGIGGYPVPGLKSDHIAGDQIMAVDPLLLAIPYDRGLERCHLLEGLEGLFCPVFLKKTENRVHDKDDDDHSTVDVLMEYE